MRVCVRLLLLQDLKRPPSTVCAHCQVILLAGGFESNKLVNIISLFRIVRMLRIFDLGQVIRLQVSG